MPNKVKKLDERKLKSEVNFRELSFTREAIDENTRTVSLAFASELPYERWWGIEILDCSSTAVRLERLLNKAPLLFNHDRDELLGVVETVSLGADRVCRATVRFGKGDEAEQRYQDVIDGILTKVSVGYAIHEYLLEKEVEGEATYRITDWEPFEISMVTIPADDSVGLGRSVEEAANLTSPPNRDSPAAPPQSTLEVKDQSTRESGFFNTQLKEKKMTKTVEELEAEGRAIAAKMNEKELEQARRDKIIEIGVTYSEHLTMEDVQRAIAEKKTPYDLQETVIQRQKTKHSDTSGQNIGMGERDIKNYSIAKAVRALVLGDWKDAGLEREAAIACGARFGGSMEFTGRNLILPFDVIGSRDFTAGTASEAGNLVATDLRGDLFTDVLRKKLALGNLGVTMLYGLNGNIDIPKKTIGMSLAYLAEVATASETQPTTGKVSMGPKRISGFVDFSKQAVIQSAMALEPMLRQDMLSEYAVQVEDAAINGSGSGSNPRGIRNVSGIGSVVGGTNGALIDWGHVVDLESAVANVNAEPDVNSGYLINTATRGHFKQTQKATNFNQFIWDNGAQPLNGYRAEVTNTMPSDLTKGTSTGVASSLLYSSMWDMLVIGTFGAIELTLDEVTQATNGMNRLVLNAFIDVACRRAANFSVMDDGLTG
jgi:HK97 family phage major capsid protein/HK97 family phage prohead protease